MGGEGGEGGVGPLWPSDALTQFAVAGRGGQRSRGWELGRVELNGK